eukprot:4672331-Amphidinium_carterae.1
MLCAGRVSSAGGMRTTHTPAIAQPSAVSILQARPADVATGALRSELSPDTDLKGESFRCVCSK